MASETRLFQILSGFDNTVSRVINDASPYGLAMEDDDPSAANAAIAAYGTGFLGFLLQQVTTDGVTALQHLAKIKQVPIAVGQTASLAYGEEGEIEVEGADATGIGTVAALLITAGTGAISASTSKHTELSFRGGKWRVAQTGDRVCGVMIDAGMTPEVATQIRCRIRVFRGGLKP
jgi:hypothetical protein